MAAKEGAGRAGEDLPPLGCEWRPVTQPRFLERPDELVVRRGRIVKRSAMRGMAYCPRWRSRAESWLIRQLAWQWWNAPDREQWSTIRVARLLGVAEFTLHRWTRSFRADPGLWRGKFAADPPATVQKLLQAREETERLRQRGWLRRPNRWRRVRYRWEGKNRKQVVPTIAELRRRQETAGIAPRKRRYQVHKPRRGAMRDWQGNWMGVQGRAFDPWKLAHDDLPLWARGILFEPLPTARDVLTAVWQPGGPAPLRHSGFGPDATQKRPGPIHFARRRFRPPR